MCGIAGILGPSASELLLDRMLQDQIHRGPDGDGRYLIDGLAMGMRRLSIIDLEHGWQPLPSRGGRVQVFQNGEIYNYRELRSQLEARAYRFATNSDTEVLAHGYDAWGLQGLLRRIDGMYAVAIFDLDTRVVHLARDRFGEKPLFYMTAGGHFVYSSSLKSFAALPWFDDDIDPIALDRYFALHYVPGIRTIFRNVRRLAPGCSMTVPLDGLVPQICRYYSLRLTHPVSVSEDVLEAEVADAVRSRLVADVPIGVFLSGGIDSSIVAAIACRHNPRINTYSIGFPGLAGDESVHAEAVARHLGTRHRTYHFDSAKFLELPAKVAEALDEPIGDQATLPLYWLCREASREVKVVLSGEGGDELFAGYSYYAPFARPSWPRALPWLLANPERGAPPLLGPAETASGFPILCGAQERRSFVEMAGEGANDGWEEAVEVWLQSARDPLQRACAADIAGWLPDDLLVKLDRIAMAHSLEGRAPFLTPRLAELALNLPPEQRLTQASTKIALRDVARKLLPAEIVERPKQGFVLPMKHWLKEWFNRYSNTRSYIAQSAVPGLAVDVVAAAIDRDLQAGVQRERLLFALVMLTEWWSAFQSARKAAPKIYERDLKANKTAATLIPNH